MRKRRRFEIIQLGGGGGGERGSQKNQEGFSYMGEWKEDIPRRQRHI